MRRCLCILIEILIWFNSSCQKTVTFLSVPGVNEFTNIDKDGKTVLPSGRYVTPAGQTIQITHDPFGLALSPDGKKSVTLHNGVFTIIDNATLASVRVPSYDKTIPSPLSASCPQAWGMPPSRVDRTSELPSSFARLGRQPQFDFAYVARFTRFDLKLRNARFHGHRLCSLDGAE